MESTLLEPIAAYMRACMRDSAHDVAHVRRVVCTALDIADTEPGADRTVVQAAALLHDIGRGAQFRDPAVCHAEAGAAMALPFLRTCGASEPDATRICDCIRTHRFRSDRPLVSLEARILFDADKLDAVGTIGLARSLLHKGKMGEPLIDADEDGRALSVPPAGSRCFFHEYAYKLKRLYDRFYTARGRELVALRRPAAEAFMRALAEEAGVDARAWGAL